MRSTVSKVKDRAALATARSLMSPYPPRTLTLTRPEFGVRTRANKKDKNFAAGLMHQQCWCWGRDVVAAGNLLRRFGFERHRSPSGPGGTRYELVRDEVHVALWGFGMWLRLPGGEQGYFARYRRGVWLLPKSFDVSGVHSDRQVKPHLRRPMHSGEVAEARKLATSAAAWCERYERWVTDSEGPGHRRQTLAKWKHAVAKPNEMIAAWRRVRGIYEAWYRTPGGPEALVLPTGVGPISGFDLKGVS